MCNNEEILKRLNEITEKEWKKIINSLTTFVYLRLKGRTLYGAHSEENLGINAVDYYIDEAIAKLYSFEWQWQFEKYSLLEQLRRIIGSLMSKNVEKYKQKKFFEIPYEDIELNKLKENEFDVVEENEQWEILESVLEECSKDDDEMQLYIMAVKECNTFDEMGKLLNWGKKKLHVTQRKLIRRLIKYKNNNNGNK